MVKTPKRQRLVVPTTVVASPDRITDRNTPPADAPGRARVLPLNARLVVAQPTGVGKKVRARKADKARKQVGEVLFVDPVPTSPRACRSARASGNGVTGRACGSTGQSTHEEAAHGGIPKTAQKLVEEAAETAIEAVREQRTSFVNESADLLYNLVVLWTELGVAPAEVWAEMDRREAMLGLAEKLPKADDGPG